VAEERAAAAMWGRRAGAHARVPNGDLSHPSTFSEGVDTRSRAVAVATPVVGASFTSGTPVQGIPLSSGAAAARGAAAAGAASGESDALRQRLRIAEAECESLRAQAGRLEVQLGSVTGERDQALERVRELEDFLRPFLDRQDRWRRKLLLSSEELRLELRLAANVAKEVHAACEGRMLEKLNERHGTLEVRHVAVSFEDMQLKWSNPDKGGLGSLLKGGSAPKEVDLRSITRLKYGHETCIGARFPQASPWLCFALETLDRSYEFICPDEYAVRCFVLALSRACPDCPGAIPTRRKFVLRKAWCKINEACSRKGKTFVGLVQEAGKLSASLRPVSYGSLKVPKVSPRSPSAPSTLPVSETRPQSRLGDAAVDPRSSGLLCLESFLASASSSSPPQRRGAWPRPGETWVFTGAVAEVEVFRDPEGKEWSNQIKCADKTGRRSVTILSAPECTNFVEVRGLDKLKFVKGWLRAVDADETWIIEKVSGK